MCTRVIELPVWIAQDPPFRAITAQGVQQLHTGSTVIHSSETMHVNNQDNIHANKFSCPRFEMCCRPTEGKARRDSDTHQALMELNAQTDEATDALRYQAPARPDHTQEEVIRNLQFWLKENYDWDGPLDGWTGKV